MEGKMQMTQTRYVHAKLPSDSGTLWTNSPPGPSVHEILQARILEQVPFPSPGDLPNQMIEPASLLSPALASEFFTTSTTWEAPDDLDQVQFILMTCQAGLEGIV